MRIKLTTTNKEIPIEGHRVRIVQKLELPSVDRRLQAMEEAGYNTFLLRTRDIFLDMLTDSGVNAMSDNQLAGMIVADDAYAGGASYYKLLDAVSQVLGYKYAFPTHQGRAAEHLIDKVFLKPGQVVPTNYHFTTTRAHIELLGGTVLEIYADEALNTKSTHPFKGNIDLNKLKDVIKKYGRDKIAYVRMEATANLMGGQPFSMENLREVRKICTENGILLVLDGSLICENAYLIKQREKGYENKTVAEIVKEICSYPDIYYMSARKNTSVRGGLIATNNEKYYLAMRDWLPVYEGFLTYGGMSVKEVEAMAIGMWEMTAEDVAGCAIEQVKYFANRLLEYDIPVVTPPGGLACHLDAKLFLPHIPQEQYPAGALAAAIYLASGIRTMERGTISTDRDKETGKEIMADLELTRIALPRRVYTVSHIEYAVDRILWLYRHRDLVKGLKFTDEPPVLRFFFGKLTALDNWGKKLCEVYKKEVGDY
jgi:tryptophanase|uniref:Tryptophanase n=1 Tax=candidate division WOR-3 bacterium TaxID=2052148 RepID=A0A7C3UZ91_UNCW3